MGQTSRLLLPFPELDETVDVPRDIQALAVAVDDRLAKPIDPVMPVGTPTDGDEIFLQNAAMATAGVVWHLRYRESAGTYKWECVGGGPLVAANANSYTWTVTGALRTPNSPCTVTVPRIGIYDVTIGATLYPPTWTAPGIQVFHNIAVGGAFTSTYSHLRIPSGSAHITRTWRLPITTPGNLTFQERCGTAESGPLAGNPTVSISDRWMEVRPVALAA